MTTIVYENEFIFNELEYFTNLINNDEKPTVEERKEILQSLNLDNTDLRFIYQKDSEGTWFKHCYKGDERINWKDTAPWMREHVWDFEKENKMFFR